jgi:hypothetical protein
MSKRTEYPSWAREVPAGRFSVARDPQGAVFALFEGDFND